jgi:very-short-patch-repair endonuclease
MIRKKQMSRMLRQNMTPAESLLWERLRNQGMGVKFHRQKPISIPGYQKRAFYADFYCASHKLIVEVDGAIHERQTEYDSFRSKILNNLGFSIIRFTNQEVLQSIEHVMKKIQSAIPQH